MTDPPPEPVVTPKPEKTKRTGWPKGKPRGPRKSFLKEGHRAADPAVLKPDEPDEFAGLSETSCCDACTPARCVISGTFMPAHDVPAHFNHFNQPVAAASYPDSTICGHPLKTPVNVFVRDPKVVERYQRAKQILEHMIIDARNKSLTRGR